MEQLQKFIVLILIAISIIGIFGIPLGDPKFVAEGIVLELSFIFLAVLSAKKIRYALIPNIIIASIVIVGNSVSSDHTDIMLTLNPLYNAIILIIGGYILQGLLLGASIINLRNQRRYAVL